MLDRNEIMVAFRTHLWVPAVALMAQRLFGAAGGAPFCVVADETRSKLDVPEIYQKLSHTDDFATLGLPKYPLDKSLWYNGDYVLYALREAYPHVKHFILSEYDVLVNVSLTPLFDYARRENPDLVAHGIGPANAGWMWTSTLVKFFDERYGSFMPFLMISARAIDVLLEKRRAIRATIGTITSDTDWPFFEGFVPSTLLSHGGMRIEALEKFAVLPYYKDWPPLSTQAATCCTLDAIIHPVLHGKMFFDRLLNEKTIDASLGPDGCLCNPNYAADRVQLAAQLARRFRATGRVSDLIKLNERIKTEKIAMDPIQLTLYSGRPSSSIWSEDLMEIVAITGVALFGTGNSATKVALESSIDGRAYELAAVKLDGSSYDGVDGDPYFFRFEPPLRARFVRLRSLYPPGTSRGDLELDQVEIYGSGVVSPHFSRG